MSDPQPALARRLGLRDATLLGLGSMLGAGVFAAVAPAAAVAGSALLVGLVIAAVVAIANATSSAQLAAITPASGGTYVYGRERLGPWWGFAAGWSFVIGKTASAAAMAITVAAYVAPPGWERLVAVVVVAGLTLVNLAGITRTALATRLIVVGVLAVLALVVVLGAAAGWGTGAAPATILGDLAATGPYGVLQSAGLLFFAFAGYARLATLGEEVVDPARTIPRAIVLALALTLVIYVAVSLTVLGVLGADAAAASPAPLASVVAASPAPALTVVVRAGAALAALGALLALIAGIGRTSLAMAREGDLPRGLAVIHPRTRVPHRAEIVLGVAVMALVLVADLRGAIGFSSFGVLLYYAIANASALRQPAAERRYPRWVAVIGLVGCLVLAATLPWVSVALGAAILAVGLLGRLVASRLRARHE